jgi:signal transduction histidine kinase
MAVALRTGLAVRNQEIVIERPDGSRSTVMVNIAPLWNEKGEQVGAINCLVDVTDRKEADQKLQESAERLQVLSRRLLEVQEVERRHLARELHDEVGQLLTGLRLLLKPPGDLPAEAMKKGLEQARGIVDELLDRVRGLSFDLRPAALDELGLVPALLALCERYTEQTAVRVNFKHNGLEGRFAPEVETTGYRIVQEALTNVARHAGVNAATVRLWSTGEALGLQIGDQGRGFDAGVVLATMRSRGLAGMQERVRLLGGELAIESRPGAGTQITAELPIRSQDAEATRDAP